MRFLVDECLSAQMARVLRDEGHDAVHVSEAGLLGKPDTQVMALATAENRVLMSADTDFGELLAIGRHTEPSVVLFRGAPHRPELRIRLFLANLDAVAAVLETGAVVVFTADKIRIRELPIGEGRPAGDAAGQD